MSVAPDRQNDMVDSLVHIDPEKVSNAQLLAILIAIRAQVAGVRHEVQSTDNKVAALKQELADYRKDQEDMVLTWKTARGVLIFIKFLAAIGLPVGAILALFASKT